MSTHLSGLESQLPLCCWVISLTHHMNGNFHIRKPVNFFNLWISNRATVPSLNLLFIFVRSLDVFESSLFPLSFLSFLCSGLSLWHSPPSSCLCISDVFLIIDVLYHSDHFSVCSFPSQITTILNLSKNILSGDFV